MNVHVHVVPSPIILFYRNHFGGLDKSRETKTLEIGNPIVMRETGEDSRDNLFLYAFPFASH